VESIYIKTFTNFTKLSKIPLLMSVPFPKITL
jgi:hypothetical protein